MQLSINNVSMRFGARILFEDVSTTFISGRRYAITGPNGAGKSTLMKILTGEIEPEKGSVTRPEKDGSPAPGSVRVRRVPRDGHGDHGERSACGTPCRSARRSTPRITTR